MSKKPFCKISKDEATAIAKEIITYSLSAGEIESRLAEAGFNPSKTVVFRDSSFWGVHAKAQVSAPDGSEISVTYDWINDGALRV